jgi:hypothetical protein
MCTAFPYWWLSVQRLLEVIYAIIFTGGFLVDPRALRPERLKWLRTSAANIRNRAIWGSRRIAMWAKNAALLGMCREGHPIFAASSCHFSRSVRALAQFFMKFQSGPELGRGITLHFLSTLESGAVLR